jgi:hypothetical protein
MAILTNQTPTELLQQMKVELPSPAIQTVFDSLTATTSTIEENTRYTPEAKRELVREAKDKALTQINAALEREKAARLKDVDLEAAQIRRELLNPAPTFDTLDSDGKRISEVARQVHLLNARMADSNAMVLIALAEGDELRRMFDDAENRGAGDVMSAAVLRAETLAQRAAREDNSISAGDNASVRLAIDLRAAWTAWRKEHPSLAERRRANDARRRKTIQDVDRAASFWLRVYGLSSMPKSVA